MRTAVFDTEMVAYLAEAKAALADLPEADQQELLEDLAQMLVEVTAEIEGSIRSLLGPPQEMILELRASAGLAYEGAQVTERSAPARFPRATADTVRQWSAGGLRWLRRMSGTARDSMPAAAGRLRPAWWVVRGLIGSIVVAFVTSYAPHFSWWGVIPVPKVFGHSLIGAAAAGAMVIASFVFGLETEAGRHRKLALLINLATVVAVVISMSIVKENLSWQYYADSYGYGAVADTWPGDVYQIVEDPEWLRSIDQELRSQGSSLEEAEMGWTDGYRRFQGPSGEELWVHGDLYDLYRSGGTAGTTLPAGTMVPVETTMSP